MIYRTCFGCIHQSKPCETRDAVRVKLRGLDATSLKWNCKARVARFSAGEPVWALTVDGCEDLDEGQPYRGHFPGICICPVGATKMLVFIEPKCRDRDDDLVFYSKNDQGFCKLPLSRLTPREGPSEQICKSCCWPASKGHMPGYSCSLDKPWMNVA